MCACLPPFVEMPLGNTRAHTTHPHNPNKQTNISKEAYSNIYTHLSTLHPTCMNNLL